MRLIKIPCASALALAFALMYGPLFNSAALSQQPLELLNSACTPGVNAPVTDPRTNRTWVLDYPCDLQPGEDVTFILNVHGCGSNTAYQHAYFPAWELKEKYRLVVATPYAPAAVWRAEDDQYLQNIVTTVTEAAGKENIRAFWLAGHSQGGLTSRRLVCTEFFESKVDGFASLSGGRLGGAPQRLPTAEVYEYPDCDDGRVIADVVRLDKGHTEGFEPNIMATLVSMMVSASGGKIQGN